MDTKLSSAPLSSEQLRRALRELPVPDPGKDFESRILARVRTEDIPQAVAQNRIVLPAAMAASLLLGLFLAPLLTNTDQPEETMVGVAEAVEPTPIRPLHVRLDSPAALEGATIRVLLPANTRIQGYADVNQLEWQADISAGANQITLPLQVDSVSGQEPVGQLTVEVEYRGARKTLHYAIPKAAQAPANQPMTQL